MIDGSIVGSIGGKVFLVGAGPGDVDLITVKGLKCVQMADVILYDRLVNKDLLNHRKNGAKMIYCGKSPNFHGVIQENINHLLVKYAKQGKTVIRLKGGDPFVFGRGAEEAETLVRENIPFEVVPGITSGIAAPAYAGIPVTHRGISSSFALVTGHTRAGKGDPICWKSLATGIDTLAIYMGVGNLSYICNQLITNGRSADSPIALIHWGTMREQKTVTGTLSTITDIVRTSGITNPSMIVVGETVLLHEKLKWFEQIKPNRDVKEKAI